MIISDILTNPQSLEKFHYFVDTRDTINFLIWKRDVAKDEAGPINAMIKTLTERYAEYKEYSIKKQPLQSDSDLIAKRDRISAFHAEEPTLKRA